MSFLSFGSVRPTCYCPDNFLLVGFIYHFAMSLLCCRKGPWRNSRTGVVKKEAGRRKSRERGAYFLIPCFFFPVWRQGTRGSRRRCPIISILRISSGTMRRLRPSIWIDCWASGERRRSSAGWSIWRQSCTPWRQGIFCEPFSSHRRTTSASTANAVTTVILDTPSVAIRTRWRPRWPHFFPADRWLLAKRGAIRGGGPTTSVKRRNGKKTTSTAMRWGRCLRIAKAAVFQIWWT